MVAPTAAPSAAISHTSAGPTVRMLPKRIANRSALKPRARLIRTTATANPPARNTASAASPCSVPRARSASIPTAPARVTASAATSGDTPRSRPRATPASATWASVSAMSDSRRGTRNTPMAGQISAVIAPTATARCMNPYWRNSGIREASVLVGDDADRGAVERGERRVAQEVARRSVEDQAAVETGELGDLAGDHPDVVAHQDQGHVALAVQVAQHRVEARLRLRIDAAGGLVEDQELGVGDEGAGDQHALLLPRRQGADAGPGVSGHADLAQDLGDARALGRADAPEQTESRHETGRDDLADGGGQAGVERRFLGDVAEAPPLAKCRGRVAEQEDAAMLGRQEPEHDPEQRGLARAIRADDAEEVAGRDREVDPLEDPNLAAIERDVLELDEGPHRAAVRWTPSSRSPLTSGRLDRGPPAGSSPTRPRRPRRRCRAGSRPAPRWASGRAARSAPTRPSA